MKILTKFLAFIAITLILNQSADAINISWSSAVPGNWNDGTKWTGGIAPGINDTAVITTAGTYAITMDVNASVAKLLIGNTTGFQTLNLNGKTLSIANNSVINSHGILDFGASSTLKGAGALTSNGKIILSSSDSINVNLVNTDTLIIDSYLNVISGAFTTTASSVVYLRCTSYIGQLTFAVGWTNNGKILMQSASLYYNPYLIITSGTLTNSATGIIQSSPTAPFSGYNRIDAPINNQGTINVDYPLHVTSIGVSTNTGTVNYTGGYGLSYYNGTLTWTSGAMNFSTGSVFTMTSGTFNWEGGTTTGSGQFSFESAVANFNTATMPAQPTTFNASRLSSTLGAISNAKRITLFAQDTISVNITNKDSIIVDSYLNVVSGTYTSFAGSVLYLRCTNYVGQITFNSGWINNGKILMQSASLYYNPYLIITTGTLTNAAAGIIQSSPTAPFTSYNRIDAAVDNQGVINVDYNLRVYTSTGASSNTGTVNYTGGYGLGYFDGTLNWNGGPMNFSTGSVFSMNTGTFNWNAGTTTGSGLFSFESSRVNFNTAIMPAQPTTFNASRLGSTQGAISSAARITLFAQDTISANITNKDTIIVDSYLNIVSGTYTSFAGSVLYLRCTNYIGQVTFNSGWINNGKILMQSASFYYNPYLIIVSGVLTNSAAGIIQSSPTAPFAGYNRIDGPVNNLGTINVDYNLRIYTIGGSSTNTGTVNISSSYSLTYLNGTLDWNSGTVNFGDGSAMNFNTATLNWNGGSVPFLGQMNFESATGNFATAATPNVRMSFSNSTLASPSLPLTSSHLIELYATDTIKAALFNTDTIRVHSYQNRMTGALTTSASAVLHFDCSNYIGQLTFSSGWTNNGKILLTSASSYYYSWLILTAGTLINSAAGIIQSSPTAPYSGYHLIDAPVDNQGGLINVDYPLHINTSTGPSANTGIMSFTSGNTLTYYNGTLNWDGGSVAGNGILAFESAVGSFNTPTMPAIPTFFNVSRLASTQPGISNARRITLYNTDTISANLNNTDTVIVDYYQNRCTGNFTNTASSVLYLKCTGYIGELRFSNGWTNNGKILMQSASSYYYASLGILSGTLINGATGIIQSSPTAPYSNYHEIVGAVNNQGVINVDYPLHINTANGPSANTGTVNFTSGYILTYYNGTLNWNGGTASGDGTLAFESAVGSFNTATMPTIPTYFNVSRLASTQAGISNARKITLYNTDTISANLNNTDTVIVDYYQNRCTGNFTNTASSVLYLKCTGYIGELRFSNGWTNNGKILMQSASSYYYASLGILSGTLINGATGIIQSSPTAPYSNYHEIVGAVNNQGVINVDYPLHINTANGPSANTGTVNFTSGYILTYYNGTLNWNGGTASGDGTLAFESAVGSFNTATMPTIPTYFNVSRLASTQAGISNARRITLYNTDTISANLNNTDTVFVDYYQNLCSGNFTNTASSVLYLRSTGYIGELRFNNGWTNNGKILMLSASNYYYGWLRVTSGTLVNAATGIIQSSPTAPYSGYHLIDSRLNNFGTLSLDYALNINADTVINKSTGIIKGTGQLSITPARLINEGTISPGASPGTLPINANIANKPTAKWNIEIGGLTAGTQHDQVPNNFSGKTDSLGGTLNVSLINGFVPVLGDSVIIETDNARVGTFASATGLAIPGGLSWQIHYNTNNVSLRVGNPSNLNIASSTGANGTISPLGNTSVIFNSSQKYTITPNGGYQVDSVIVDGVKVDSTASYTFSNVVSDHTIRVTFTVKTTSITATAGTHGAISPPGSTNVPEGGSQQYNITADPCYLIDSVIVDGSFVGNSSIYNFTNVTSSHTIRAVFRNAPKITAGGPLTFCAGGNVLLDAGSGYTNYSWSNGATTQTTTVSTSNTYTCTITSTGICSNSTSVLVTVNPLPIVIFPQLYAADNGHVCLDGPTIDLSINGTGTPGGGTYSGLGIVNNVHQYFFPTTAGVGATTLTYTYTDVNSCSNAATRSVTVDQNATVNAGTDIVLCKTLVANLNGIKGGSAASVTWSSNGTGAFNNASLLNATYTLSSADSLAKTVTLTLTTNDPSGPCGAVSDQVIITYNPDAIADAGPAQICTSPTVSVSGSMSGYPANPHWTSTGTGSFINANALSTTYNASAADVTSGKVKLVLTPIDPLGNCTFNGDTLEAWFDPNYAVSAGTDVLLCGINDTIAHLAGSFTNASQVTWTTNGSGTFSNIHDVNANYTLSLSDRANGFIILTLTSDDPAGPCNLVADNVIVKYKYAIADAGATDICGDTNTVLSGSVSANQFAAGSLTFQWTTTGSGNFSTPTLSSSNYHASNADVTAGKVKVYFTPVDASQECTYVKDSAFIWFTPHYSVNAGPDTMQVCSNATLSLTGSKVNAQSTTWTSGGSGQFGDASALSTTYTPSVSDSLAGHVRIYLTSDDPNGPCGVAVDSIYVVVHPAPAATAGSNSPVCLGTDLDLTASGGTSYSWTGPNSFISIEQNIIRSGATADMSGTYSVIITNSFGCINSATTDVVVESCGCVPPVLSATVKDVTCFGGSDGGIDLHAIGGSGGNTYSWSNNTTTEDINGVIANTYTVTVTADGGCTATLVRTVQQPSSLPPVTITAVGGKTALCDEGNIVLDAGFGYAGYLWSANNATTRQITVSSANTYSVTITDGNGCSNMASITITQLPAIVVTATPDIIACYGETTIVEVTATGGSGIYSAGTGIIPDVAGGSQTFTVTDNNGCTGSKTINITEPDSISITVTPGTIACNGGTTTVEVDATGGSGIYIFGTGIFTDQIGGDQIYIVIDDQTCYNYKIIFINQPDSIIGTTSVTNASCPTCADGALAIATATGGTGTLHYTNLTGLLPGSYCITITDDNGCTGQVCGVVGVVGTCTLQAFGDVNGAILCHGDSAGITITATGGSGFYLGTGSYKIRGQYKFTVVDQFDGSCTATVSGFIEEPEAIVVTATYDSIKCHDGTTDITLTATSGTGSYSWGTGSTPGVSGSNSWRTGNISGLSVKGHTTILNDRLLNHPLSLTDSKIITNVPAGAHNYTVTDANGCKASATVFITQPAAITGTVSATNASCPTCADGTLSIVTATGGTGTLHYTNLTGLLPGQHCITITDDSSCTGEVCGIVGNGSCTLQAFGVVKTVILCHGDSTAITVTATGGSGEYIGTGTFKIRGQYSFTVIDINDPTCTSTVSGFISEPDVIVVTATYDSVLCNGGKTTVTVGATGGSGNYSSGTGILDNVGAGAHTYIVTDDNGCTGAVSITISQPDAIVVTTAHDSIKCHGGSTSVTVSATGGSGIYNSGTGVVTGQSAGSHTYTVTDDNGCTGSVIILISDPAAITGTVSVTNASCPACADGALSIATATGGTGNLHYTNLTGLLPGSHCITITDDSSCIGEACGIVGSGSCTLNASGEVSGAIDCHGDSTTITISATGGSGEYAGTGIFKIRGQYSFTVTDLNDETCASTVSGFISEPDAIVVTATPGTITCHGGTTSVTVGATGGSGNYSSGTGTFTDIAVGTYTYTVTDDNGCTGVTTITISQPDSIIVNITPGTIPCHSERTSAMVSATGGSGVYTFGIGTFFGLTAGDHTFKVNDNNGCSGSATITIAAPDSIIVTATPGAIACHGGTTSVTVNATGGSGNYSSGTGTFTGVASGSLTYTVTDMNGCTGGVTIAIGEPDVLAVTAGSNSPVCTGDTIHLTSSGKGGTGTLVYAWTGANGFNANGQNPNVLNATTAATGTYKVTLTDASGCTAADSIAVTVNPGSNVTINAIPDLCVDASSVNLKGSPAVGKFSGKGVTGNKFDPSKAGVGTFTITYTYTGATCNGKNTATTTVHVLPTPNINITVSPLIGCNPNTIYIGYGPQSATLTANGSVAIASYQWYKDGKLIAGAVNKTLVVTAKGNYSVTAVSTGGCQSASSCGGGIGVRINVVDIRCGNNCNGQKHQVQVCHPSSSCGGRSQALCIDSAAVKNYLKCHPGDCLGSCGNSHREGMSAFTGSLSLNIYPNPFSAFADAEFSLPESGAVRLELYDIKGALAATLFSGEAEGGLSYKVSVDGATLPEGIYIAVLITENDVMRQKLILAK